MIWIHCGCGRSVPQKDRKRLHWCKVTETGKGIRSTIYLCPDCLGKAVQKLAKAFAKL